MHENAHLQTVAKDISRRREQVHIENVRWTKCVGHKKVG